MSTEPISLLTWANKIDNRIGPISGSDADQIAVLLRDAAKRLSGIPHPTGSEQFQAALTDLMSPGPWDLADRTPGEIKAANGALVLTVDHGLLDSRDKNALALWVVMAVNTLAGWRMES